MDRTCYAYHVFFLQPSSSYSRSTIPPSGRSILDVSRQLRLTRETPCSLAVSGKPVNAPARNIPEIPGVFHRLQEGYDVADFLNDGEPRAGSIITLDESPGFSLDDPADLHKPMIAGVACPV
jgi:hypothetical protein